MARAATTADAFNAVAEPRRRQILDVLSGGERPVNDLVRLIGLAQPLVSKHLRVVRDTFSEKDGRTALTILMLLPSQSDRDAVINCGMEGGMQEAMDHLEQVAVSLH